MLQVDEWAEMRRLHFAEELGVKTIARRLGRARNTVRAAVRSQGPPQYKRKRRGSAVDAYEDEIRELLREHPRMAATVIAERVGWDRGMTVFRERIRELRPMYLLLRPYERTEYKPGELAQWDLWFPAVDIPVGYGQKARLPVMVGVSGYSRWIVGRMIPSRETHDVLGGHLECLLDLGAVPRLGVYDNEPAIGRRRGPKPEFTEAFQRFRGTLGMGAHILRPRHPEGKGAVERAIGYLETSFLPGRSFSCVDDFNCQLQKWLRKANGRVHRIIRERPSDRIAADRREMLALPPVLPDVRWRKGMRLPRDHYVRFGTCDYSVHPKAIGRHVEILVDLSWVVVRLGEEELARHRRCLAKHRTVSDPEHLRARKELQGRALRAVPSCGEEVQVRDLAVYDRLLGVA
jgi:transposase